MRTAFPRRRLRAVCPLLATLVAIAAATSAAAQPFPGLDVTLDPNWRLVARFEPGAGVESIEDARRVVESHGIEEYAIVEQPDGGWLVSFRRPDGAKDPTFDELEQEPSVDFVERDQCREYLPRENAPPAGAPAASAPAGAGAGLTGVVRRPGGAPLPGAKALLQESIPTPEGFVRGEKVAWSERDGAPPVFAASDAAGAFRLAASVAGSTTGVAEAAGSEAPGGCDSEDEACRCLEDDEPDEPGPPSRPPPQRPGGYPPGPSPERMPPVVQRPGGYPPGPPAPESPAGPGDDPLPPSPEGDGRVVVAVGWEMIALPLPGVLGGIVVAGTPGGAPPVGPEAGPTPDPPGETVAEDPGTPTGRPPPEELPPEEPPPPEDPPPPPPEEPRDPRRSCCGLAGNTLFYPITDDPMVPPDVQEAFHSPAIAAFQVHLHDGSFFERTDDLQVKSVGMPFQWSRQYRSNVTTKQGGLIGNRWDFVYNKRVLPLASRTLDGKGLRVETIGVDAPALLYFDGSGRGDRYAEAHSEWRKVRNFGVELFEAWVTTYVSPPGAFHVIQRYVLEDERQPHPFDPPDRDHPNVEPGERIFYVLRDRYGFRLVFNCRGQLIYLADRNENFLTFYYEGPLNPLTQNPMLTRIRDTADSPDREYHVKHVGIGQGKIHTNVLGQLVDGREEIWRIESIEDFDGRKVTFRYTGPSDAPELESAEFLPDASRGVAYTTKYGYAAGSLLETITAPREAVAGGAPYLRNHWNGARVVRQTLGDPLADPSGDGDFQLRYGARIQVRDRVGDVSYYTLETPPGATSPVVDSVERFGASGEDNGPWKTGFDHDGDYLVTEVRLPGKGRILFDYDEGAPITQGAVRNWLDRNLTYETSPDPRIV